MDGLLRNTLFGVEFLGGFCKRMAFVRLLFLESRIMLSGVENAVFWNKGSSWILEIDILRRKTVSMIDSGLDTYMDVLFRNAVFGVEILGGFLKWMAFVELQFLESRIMFSGIKNNVFWNKK